MSTDPNGFEVWPADLRALVDALYRERGTGCCLHIALDDGNMSDSDIEFCIKWARDAGHGNCEALGMLLRSLSEDQRHEGWPHDD